MVQCILCAQTFSGSGNDARPLSDGRCCDACNQQKVIPARIEEHDLVQEVGRKFPGIFGNRGLGDADPVNLLANRIMNEGPNRPLEWIFSEIERALPDARKVAGAMYRNIEIKEQNAKLEQEIKKVEEECNFWREATLKLSKEVPADDETMARLGWTKEYK
jgi:hypothetical protein